MRDLIVDLSTLTTIGKYNLDELVLKSIAVIGHDIEESLREHRNVISIDIGIRHKRAATFYNYIQRICCID